MIITNDVGTELIMNLFNKRHFQGWYEGVKLLLRNGASQSIYDKSGRTPLHAATYATDRE